MHQFLTFLVVFNLVFRSAIFCQKVDSTKTTQLSEVNISAFRSTLSNLETPAHIESFSIKNLQNKAARTLPEFFDNNGSFWLQKTNHGSGSLFLRGLTGNQTLTLIDGIRLNNSTFRYGPNQYLNTVNSFTISHLEVLSGGGSVQYGSDAIGGLLQVFTKEPNFDKKYDIHLNTRAASHNMEKSLNSSISFTHKNFGLIMVGSMKHFGHLVGGKNIGIQKPSGYIEYDVDLKAKWNIKPQTSLLLAHQKVNQNNASIYHKVIFENFSINEISKQNRNLTYLKFENKTENGVLNKQQITLSFQNNPETRLSQKNNSSILRYENDRIKTFGFSANNFSQITPKWTMNTGFESYFDHVTSLKNEINNGLVTNYRGLYPNNSKYNSQSIYNLHHYQLNTFYLNAGIRYNLINLAIPVENIGISKSKYEATVYNFSITKKIKENFAIYSSLNTSFRAPNIDDLGTLGIVDFRYEIPSITLKPENAKQVEIGLKYLNTRHSIHISVYKNYLQDLITREKIEGKTIENYQVYAKMNTGKAQIKGLEFTSKSKINANFEINTGFCYTYGQDLTKNEPLRRIPPIFGNITTKYMTKGWYFQPNIVMAGTQKRLASGDVADVRIGPEGTAGFTILNTQIGKKFKSSDLDFNLVNMANSAYKTHGSGIYQAGRSLWISYNIYL